MERHLFLDTHPSSPTTLNLSPLKNVESFEWPHHLHRKKIVIPPLPDDF